MLNKTNFDSSTSRRNASIQVIFTISLAVNSFLFVSLASAARAPKAPPPPYDQTYEDIDKVVKKYVKPNGLATTVDYKALSRGKMDLIRDLKNTSNLPKKTYDTWTEKEKEAFLINAYNAFTLQLVSDNYPVKSNSMKKFGIGTMSPYKMQFFKLLNGQRSLDDVEHNLLLKNFSDPRIHFALTNATMSGPNIRNEAYTADKLDEQLNDQLKSFLRDGVRNSIDTAAKTLKLSSIFKTYESDFTKNEVVTPAPEAAPTATVAEPSAASNVAASPSAAAAPNSVQKFISTYISDDPLVQKDLQAGAYTVTYAEDNWELNDGKN